MATTVEFDPIFMKALRYFRSKNPDSSENLKEMLDEAIDSSKRSHGTKETSEKNSHLSKPVKSLSKLLKPSIINPEHRKKEKDSAQKRQYDKIQRDLDELNHENAKRSHFDTPSPTGASSSTSSGSRPSSKHNSPAHDLISQTNGCFGKTSPLTPADAFELEMEGLACALCKDMTVGSGNQLVECQDCHNLYHQDCHQPTISDNEINDPRCIWYCARCKRNMKKQVKQNFVHSPLPSHTLASPVDLFKDKNADVKNKTSITPFKRTEMKPSVTSSNNGGGSMSGWVALSGKPVLNSHKSIEESTKSSELKPETSIHKSSGLKDKSKVPKNHSKNLKANFLGSDAFADALSGRAATSDKTKSSAMKSATVNNKAKHISLSTMPWLSGPGSNNTSKVKSGNTPNSMPHKAAPFPKASAATPPNVAKSTPAHDNAAKQMQLMKKKAAAKLQQKRTRV